ncbi:hypothetical protein HMPREF9248_0137 [Fannyhessea vaginae PB189-T1-4]|uniref:Uncharacterized protein n=1 Tax=Fannyhessea vaginae PB189-T1-4 TaxID=866774 RepID=A0ABN0B1Z7_9ACTN|nr:hypothetical protein HMPREF9248_0137 [Fannyhessea vaginae PB189-T1-4]
MQCTCGVLVAHLQRTAHQQCAAHRACPISVSPQHIGTISGRYHV